MGAHADLRLVHDSVAERHGELMYVTELHWHLTCCGSLHGCWRWRAEQWQPLRQAFLGRDELLRFGALQTSISALLVQLHTGPHVPTQESSHPVGPVERDPRTGELVRRIHG